MTWGTIVVGLIVYFVVLWTFSRREDALLDQISRLRTDLGLMREEYEWLKEAVEGLQERDTAFERDLRPEVGTKEWQEQVHDEVRGVFTGSPKPRWCDDDPNP